MPAKPIKHDIKVFCVCCAVSGIMLGYEVYCGNKDKKTDGTSVQVCDRLVKVKEAELTKSRGHTLYTDSYYRLIKLANISLKSTDGPSLAQLFPHIRRHVRIMTFHF